MEQCSQVGHPVSNAGENVAYSRGLDLDVVNHSETCVTMSMILSIFKDYAEYVYIQSA